MFVIVLPRNKQFHSSFYGSGVLWCCNKCPNRFYISPGPHSTLPSPFPHPRANIPASLNRFSCLTTPPPILDCCFLPPHSPNPFTTFAVEYVSSLSFKDYSMLLLPLEI